MRFWLFIVFLAAEPVFGDRGEQIYRQHCASCHGDQGQGVAEEYDEALVGKKSVTSLAKYIHRTMPEEDENAVVDEDARLVAAYIHGAFYSPEAQAHLQPVRKDLLRLTRHQHRRALTDLVQSFRKRAHMNDENGLRGHFFNKEKMNNRKTPLAKRVDRVIAFDLEKEHGIEKIDPKAHSIYWSGSLLPPETGTYRFRIHSPNGFRLFLNQQDQRSNPFIDAWVSSGNTMRTVEESGFLMGGHPVPIFLEFVSYKESKSSIVLEWKPPHGTWKPIPSRYLFTAYSPEALLVSTDFPADDSSQGYERGSSISKGWKQAAANAAIETTVKIFDDLDRLAKTKSDDPERPEKLKQFCVEMATRAFGRPLTGNQHTQYIESLFQSSGSDHETAVKRSLMLIFTSPYFLYPSLNKNEKGDPDGHTTATHLALTIWDSVPDEQLRKAAANNQLSSKEQLEKQLWRMLGDPRAKTKIRRFFHHWLGLAERENLDKDSERFPDFKPEVIADLRTSLDLFLDEVVWSEKSDYRRLFTEKRIYQNPRLARIYGAPMPGTSDFELLPPADEGRAGLFTHPLVLAAFSYHHQTSPIHRGVYLSRNLLGRFLKPPPQAIEFKDADFKPHLTMREKVTEITKDESCMACHSIINPVGFSLENYDAIGRFRTEEKGKAINTISNYPTPDDRSIELTGPRDLAEIALGSPEAHRAFIKHLFHHLVQQPVNAFGHKKMDQLHQSFRQSNFHIRYLVETIVRETVPR